ncbi:hypothetical protein MTO96_013725 [Rhipicephalus appendiculatus]
MRAALLSRFSNDLEVAAMGIERQLENKTQVYACTMMAVSLLILSLTSLFHAILMTSDTTTDFYEESTTPYRNWRNDCVQIGRPCASHLDCCAFLFCEDQNCVAIFHR